MVFNAKPLQDAAALVEKGDFARASDKLWDAVSLAVKASTGEWTAEGPREIRRLVDRLFQQTADRDLLRLYSVADSLRENGSENFLSGESVRAYAEDVRALVEKLHALPDSQADVAQALSPVIGHQADFENRIKGLTRRETRQQVLAELARVESQIDTFAPARNQSGIPGSPEARIANALQQVDRRENPAGKELGLYKQWLLGVLTGERHA